MRLKFLLRTDIQTEGQTDGQTRKGKTVNSFLLRSGGINKFNQAILRPTYVQETHKDLPSVLHLVSPSFNNLIPLSMHSLEWKSWSMG